jgi:hypothetical protein
MPQVGFESRIPVIEMAKTRGRLTGKKALVADF